MTKKGNIDRSLIGKRFGKLTVLDFDHMGGQIVAHIGYANVTAEIRQSS